MSETLEVRVARLEATLAQLPTILESGFRAINTRLDFMNQRLDRIDGRLDRIDGRMDRLEEHQRQDFRFLLRLILSGYAGGIAAFGAVFWLLAKIKGWV